MRNLFHLTARGARRHVAMTLPTVVVLLTVTFGAPSLVSAQVIFLAPPTARYENAPPPRAGYAWQHGYWGWQQGRYVWV
jgi:OmpA-OmpF porin, OOP family